MKLTVYILLVIVVTLIFSLLFALPIMWLWNWLIPIIFPTGIIVQHLTFWQAFGVSMFINLLLPRSIDSKFD